MGWRAELKGLGGAILVPIVFFWRELLGLSVFAGFDFTHLILPLHDFTRQALWNGSLPHWNPYLFAGFPQIAEGESGIFYPGNLMMLLPGDQSVLLSWNIVLHVILTGCLMYAFLRGRGISRTASGWLAVFYQLIPGLILRFETVGLFQAVAWIPGFYWACERAVGEGGQGRWNRWLTWTLFGTIEIAFMYLAGSSQIAFYTLVGGVFFIGGAIAMGPKPKERAYFGLGTFLICSTIGAILAAVQLMPTSILATLSYRLLEADFQYYRMGTWITLPRLASLFMFPAVKGPDEILDYVSSLGYIGLLPFVLAGMTLSLHRRYMNPILAPFFLGFFGLILAFGFNFPTWHDLITYPGFNLFRALGRMILPTQVALFALSAFALDALFKFGSDRTKDRWLIAGAWGSMLVGLGLLVWYIFAEGFPLSTLEMTGLVILLVLSLLVVIGLIVFFRTRNTKWLIGLLSIWLVIHVAGMYPVKSAITMNRVSFNRMSEVLALENSGLERNPERPLRILSVEEGDNWDPLLMRLGRHPFNSGDTLPLPALGNEFALGNVGTLNGYTPLVTWRWHEVADDYAARGLRGVGEASGRLRITLSLMDADAVVSPSYFTGGDGFRVTDVDIGAVLPLDWHLVETPGTVPFASIPRYVEAWDGSAWEAYKHWITQDGYVAGEWVVIEPSQSMQLPFGMVWGEPRTNPEDLNMPIPAWGGIELAENARCEVLSVERGFSGFKIEVRADSPCWLVMRESYIPGWRAWVDDVETKVVPADYLFCAIPIPEGEHSVWMSYSTPGFRTGSIISAIAGIVWLIAMVIGLSVGRKRKAGVSIQEKTE